MLLWKRLFGKRDILIPYFYFSKVLRGNMESFILKEVYRLRYEVYCLECAYLEAQDFGEGLETDDYDDCAIHFAAYTLDHNIVGTVRLVQPKQDQVYPFEGHCKVFADFERPQRANTAEVSRLVVRKSFRRRRGDSMQGVSKDFFEKGTTAGIQPPQSPDKRSNSPLLLLGMYREMYRHSRANGIRFWYAAMERSLARSLDKMGFRFMPIGPKVDYFGPVTPHMMDLNEMIERLRGENRFLAAWLNDERIPFWIMLKSMAGKMLASRRKRS